MAEAINARATIIEKGLVAEALLTGAADIAVQQLSELATVADVAWEEYRQRWAVNSSKGGSVLP
jgi:hypothetical protein